MLKLCMYINCIGFWSLCCCMHTLCNVCEPTGRSLHQLTFGVFFAKSLKHNHKKTDDEEEDDDDYNSDQ